MKRNLELLIGVKALIVTLLLITQGSTIMAQTENGNKTSSNVENVSYKVSGSKVIINYDLIGNSKQLYKVSLILRRTSSTDVKYVPKTVTGDIGEGKFAGEGRQIIWDIEKDFPGGLSGEDYYFIIQAEKVNPSSSDFLLWTGLGVAAAAAIVTYIVVGNQNGTSNPEIPGGGTFPPPPGRP